MAWTDQCKIEAVAQIDHKVKQGKSVREALREVSKACDIPANTLRRWKYPSSDHKPVTSSGNANEQKPFDEDKARDRLVDMLRKELNKFPEDKITVATWEVYAIIYQEFGFRPEGDGKK